MRPILILTIRHGQALSSLWGILQILIMPILIRQSRIMHVARLNRLWRNNPPSQLSISGIPCIKRANWLAPQGLWERPCFCTVCRLACQAMA